jgi:hypothetical protein
MSYSLLSVLLILFVYGFLHKRAEKVEFETKTTMNLTSSKGALYAGLGVCILTVALYVVFW